MKPSSTLPPSSSLLHLSTCSTPRPPHICRPPSLQLKQVDFVGYLLNPKFSRGKAPGEAARLACPLRNQRVQLQSETRVGSLEMEKADRTRRRIEQGVGNGLNKV